MAKYTHILLIAFSPLKRDHHSPPNQAIMQHSARTILIILFLNKAFLMPMGLFVEEAL
jgi:hypothetical protein